MTEVRTHQFDTTWNEVTEHAFPEFMNFRFPDAHAQVDWTQEDDCRDQQ